MKLFIGMNGDASARIILFASDEKQARKLAKKKIKEDELEEQFPCLDFDEHEVKEGIIDVLETPDLY